MAKTHLPFTSVSPKTLTTSPFNMFFVGRGTMRLSAFPGFCNSAGTGNFAVHKVHAQVRVKDLGPIHPDLKP